MSKSFNEIDPRDLVTLEGVRVGAIHYPTGPRSSLPYFEVEHEGENLRVRFRESRTDLKEWLETHQDVDIDLTIFPFRWAIGEKSGVVNYFSHAKVKES